MDTDLSYRISSLMADFVRFAIQDALPDSLDIDDDHDKMRRARSSFKQSLLTRNFYEESEDQSGSVMAINDSTNIDVSLTPEKSREVENEFKLAATGSRNDEDGEISSQWDHEEFRPKFSRSPDLQKMLQTYFLDRNRTSYRNRSLRLFKQPRTRYSWHRGSQRHYKTELCKRYLSSSSGECCYGEKCQFAHGLNELRFAPRHFRYKSEICYSFHVLGICTYGKRCDFIHDESVEKLRVIRLQNQLFHMYRKAHPEVRDIRLVELLGFVPEQDEDQQNWSPTESSS